MLYGNGNHSVYNVGHWDNIIESHPKVGTRFCSFLVFYAPTWGRRVSLKCSLFFLAFCPVYSFFILLLCLLIKFCFLSSKHPGSCCRVNLYILIVSLGSPIRQNWFLNLQLLKLRYNVVLALSLLRPAPPMSYYHLLPLKFTASAFKTNVVTYQCKNIKVLPDEAICLCLYVCGFGTDPLVLCNQLRGLFLEETSSPSISRPPIACSFDLAWKPWSLPSSILAHLSVTLV